MAIRPVPAVAVTGRMQGAAKGLEQAWSKKLRTPAEPGNGGFQVLSEVPVSFWLGCVARVGMAADCGDGG